VSREVLIEEAQHALRIAEDAQNAAAMVGAIRLMAELAQISLRCPEDRAQPSQHVHLHGDASLVDRPPPETMQEWIERKNRELSERSAKARSLKLVPSTDDS